MHKIVAIVPLFNHERTIGRVLQGIVAHNLQPIVVDDGSTDDGANTARNWMAQHCPGGLLIALERNRGKARALLAGFAEARRQGATHALTIDADGQHDTGCIPSFVGAIAGARAGDHAGASNPILVLGDRQPIPAGYPLHRFCGRMLSGLAVRAACGAVVGDAACGMRLYPLDMVQRITCISGRYAWEEEAIIRCAWRGAHVVSVNIPTIYQDAAVARSHYRFVRDWPEGLLVLVGCVVERTLNPLARTRASLADLAWPLTFKRSSDASLFCALLACIGFAIAAVGASVCAALGASVTLTAAAALLAAWIGLRTRASLLAMAAGWCAGTAWPIPAAALALAGVPIVCLWLLRRRIPTSQKA